ncbi:hypothetical protein niasHS_013919 [Heterodera schachtii]|uniref:Uncharacterized protein n=1 Tax=Heterodera schachtii TaxID=97005 RepID=A0ABD2INK5_HETSC
MGWALRHFCHFSGGLGHFGIFATFRKIDGLSWSTNCPCAQLSLCTIVTVPNCPFCAQLSLCPIVTVPNCPCAQLSLCPVVPSVPNCPCSQLSLCTIVTVPNYPFCAQLSLCPIVLVLNNKIGEGEAVPNLNVTGEDDYVGEFLGFLLYDQKFGHHIANAFNETVFCAAKNQMPKKVVDQILQLTFSLAIRIVLCAIYENYFTKYYDVGGWQLEQLLSAFQILSTQRGGGTNENGIFPFQIIRIDAQTKEQKHFWDGIEADSAMEPQFIENFNFLLKLGEFTLSYYEVYKVLETILMRWSNTGNSSAADKNGEHPPELYTFMEQYFNSKLNSQILQKNDKKQIGSSSKSMKPKMDANESDVRTLSKTDCAFVHFGTALLHRIDFLLIGTISDALSEYKNLISEREKECGTKAHRELDRRNSFYYKNVTRDNTPSERCVRLEMDLFREPLWNYARMVGIDSNQCIAVLQFGEALRKRIQAKLDSAVEMEKQQQQNPIENPSKLNEFKILKEIFKEIKDKENYGKMQMYEEKFHMDLLVGEGIAALNELLAILDQIIGHYADGTEESCQLGKRRSIVLNTFTREKINFSKILFETLSKHFQNVNYDEKRQLLSFPLSTGEHIITRLSELIRQQRHTIQKHKHDGLSRQIDVKKTIQNIASMEPIHFYERKLTLSSDEWINFDLFLSMAIRLSAQIERNDCLNALLLGGPEFYQKYYTFDYKIQITNGNLVEINTPTWHVPYFVCWRNNKDWKAQISDHEALVQREAEGNFEFLRSLSEYSPTFDELIKMANFFAKIENDRHILDANIEDDGQILDIPSDFKTLEIVMKFLKKPYDYTVRPKVPDQNLPCISAYFVDGFLRKAMTENHYLAFFDIESNGMVIEKFAEKKERMCGDKSMKNEMNRFFGENIVNFANAIKINFAAPIENFGLLHSLSEYSPTVYEVIKMAKILGKMENDGHILVLRSDPQILHFLLYLANSTAEESANQTKFVIKYSFCFLAQFVEKLLKKAMKVNELKELLNIELIGEAIQSFADKKEQKCANKK